MNFLLILVAAVVEFTVASAAGLRSADWSRDWAGWANGLFGRHGWWDGPWGGALVLAVPVVLVAVAFAVLGEVSSFLAHVAALGVLLLMLGPPDLNAELEAAKRRRLVAGEDLVDDVDAPWHGLAGEADPGPPTGDAMLDAQRGELAAVALAADVAWYQPLFWFFALGPVGAVLYRLCANLRHTELAPGVARAVAVAREALEWFPARLTAFALGLAGTLVPVIECVREHGWVRWGGTDTLVGRAALAAIDEGRVQRVVSSDLAVYRLNVVHGLVKRALSVWLVFLAVLALLF